MRGAIVAGVGLTLGLLVGGVTADEIQWRSASGTPAPQQPPTVVLRAPVPIAGAVQQSSFTSISTDNSPVVRGKLLDPPAQPMPIGPVPPDIKMPGASPAEPIPAPSNDPNWGAVPPQPGVIIQQPGTIIQQPGPIMSPNGGVDPAGCGCNHGPGVSGGAWGDCGTVGGSPCGDCTISSSCGSCGTSSLLCTDWVKNRWAAFCGDGCDTCCDCCCAPRSCFWISAEYLLWTVKSAPSPFLVTANNSGAPPVLGQNNGTVVAFGGSSQDLDMRSGARVTLGFALPCTGNNLGFETTYFFLADRTQTTTFSSSGMPGSQSLGRPFTDIGPATNGFVGNQNAELVALPGVVGGSVSVRTTNELWGIEENLRYPICCGCNWKVDFLTGFRYMQLDEGLLITENLNVLSPLGAGSLALANNANPGGVGNILLADNFSTRNEFYGGQIGIDAECRWNRWFLGATGKLAMGDMHQTVEIDGGTNFLNGPNPGVQRGGLLALPGTIGQYSRDTFAIVPELDFKIGFYFTERLRGYVGYSVIYASSVVRPGDQINTNVNPTYLPSNPSGQLGAPPPALQVRSTDFWAQGVNFGLEWRY